MNAVPTYAAGAVAVILGLKFLITDSHDIPTLFSLVFLIAISITDTVKSRIPNYLTFSIITAGLIFHSCSSHLSGFLFSASGFALGLGLFLVPFLMGGMGAGDVKALAALGALVGPGDVFNVFLFTGLTGGAMAIMHYALNHNLLRKILDFWAGLMAFMGTRNVRCLLPATTSEKLRFPYAAAIALGYFSHLTWGSPFQNILH